MTSEEAQALVETVLFEDVDDGCCDTCTARKVLEALDHAGALRIED